LREIWAHVALEASEAIATRLIDQIEAGLRRVAEFPLSGAPREQLSPGLRMMIVGSYVIYYAPRDAELIVVRVLHGARDAAALATKGGFPPS
jgi:toxin ParE1/3/4